jgi:hypothetical protein
VGIIVPGYVADRVMVGKNLARNGWGWGLLLSWIGVIICACRRPAETYVPRAPGILFDN